jgi:hypothetical protein
MVTGKQIKVQLKGRIHFAKKYEGKQIWIAFRYADRAYLYPHDIILRKYKKINPMRIDRAWNRSDGAVHWKRPTKSQLSFLKEYEVGWSLG